MSIKSKTKEELTKVYVHSNNDLDMSIKSKTKKELSKKSTCIRTMNDFQSKTNGGEFGIASMHLSNIIAIDGVARPLRRGDSFSFSALRRPNVMFIGKNARQLSVDGSQNQSS